MPQSPRLIRESPNVENTLPLPLFRAQYPARISQLDGDKFVLHGGRSACSVQLLGDVAVDPKLSSLGTEPVSIYVLNTSVILWVPDAGVGLDLPYTSIVLHAMRELDGEPVLYLQVLSSDLLSNNSADEAHTSTVEVMIRAGPDGGSGLLATPSSIEQIYHALSTCSAFHVDSASEDEDEQWITGPGESGGLEFSVEWANSGDADDLGDFASDGEGEAGAVVDVGEAPLAGRRRGAEAEQTSGSKRR